MFQYRQVLVRLRAGDTVREIARSGLMGRDKLGALRTVAEQQGWLDASADVPGDEAIVAALGAGRRAERDQGPAEQAAGGEMHEVWNVGAHGDPPSKSGGIVPVVQDFPARQDGGSGTAFRLSSCDRLKPVLLMG